MTELTRAEQEAGAARIRRWGRDHIQTVVDLPARERDLIVLAAGLMDLAPGEPVGRPADILELP